MRLPFFRDLFSDVLLYRRNGYSWGRAWSSASKYWKRERRAEKKW